MYPTFTLNNYWTEAAYPVILSDLLPFANGYLSAIPFLRSHQLLTEKRLLSMLYAAEGKSKRPRTVQGLLERLLEIGTWSPSPTFHGRNKTLGQDWWGGKEVQSTTERRCAARGRQRWDLPWVPLKSVWSAASQEVISIEWRLQLSVAFSREGEKKAQGPVLLSFTHKGIGSQERS